MAKALHIIYASTSGHTEYVVDALQAFLADCAKDLAVTRQLAETAAAEDLQHGDVLLLACGTWNTGGVEGQMNIHMDTFLRKRAAAADLGGKPCALIALGDERYYYTCRAVEHLTQFVKGHNGVPLCPPLLVVNEPYGQEERVRKWGAKFLDALRKT